MEPVYLIIDGYARESREEFDRSQARHAWQQYADMLLAHMPEARHQVWFPSDDPEPPAGPEAFAGLLWTGCNLTIYHDHDARVQRMIAYQRRAYAAGTPAYGSCWGLQMAAVAAGGEVKANPRGREMGLARKIHLTAQGSAHPFLSGKPQVYSGFISHLDEVTALPKGATLLSTNDFTHVQALAVTHERGTFWAVQYHPEYHLGDMARLIKTRAPKLLPEGFFANLPDLERYVQELEALHREPGRKDLRWRLDIDDDVLDRKVRQLEFQNWLERLVWPRLAG